MAEVWSVALSIGGLAVAFVWLRCMWLYCTSAAARARIDWLLRRVVWMKPSPTPVITASGIDWTDVFEDPDDR